MSGCRPAKAYIYRGRVWLETAARTNLTRREPLEDESAAVQNWMEQHVCHLYSCLLRECI